VVHAVKNDEVTVGDVVVINKRGLVGQLPASILYVERGTKNLTDEELVNLFEDDAAKVSQKVKVKKLNLTRTLTLNP